MAHQKGGRKRKVFSGTQISAVHLGGGKHLRGDVGESVIRKKRVQPVKVEECGVGEPDTHENQGRKITSGIGNQGEGAFIPQPKKVDSHGRGRGRSLLDHLKTEKTTK